MAQKKSSPNKPKTQADSPAKKTGKKKADVHSAMSSDKHKSEGRAKGPPPSTKSGDTENRKPKNNKPFPIVGVGASAGGLEAFTNLLHHLPSDTGMAFVLVQHLDPTHQSMLSELLSKATKMPVKQVKDGMSVEPNHVYIIPPNTNMDISHGILSLITRPPKTSTPHVPIDLFFRSLAADQKSKAIGVILSGTGSDGAKGLETIKAEGGITFVQDEKSAKYDGMPRSAVATGYADFILPPEKIAGELARIGHHPYVVHPKAAKTEELISESENGLKQIFISLRSATGADFSDYKPATIKRRIMRRMALHRIERLEDYVNHIKDNPAEVEALYQDILIKVTGFFRDSQTFQVLKNRVFPSITKNKSSKESIRIWVPGCSTGEEVYSIAMCLMEFLGSNAVNNFPVQIFATDINEAAIEKARAGIYIENIMVDLSQERLRRFFTKVNNGYQINKTIREICVFAKQDVTKDPPFSKLDLISCRNVLIYLGPILQKKVMSIFHYALKPTGFLMLGNSETISLFSDLFSLTDKKHKIYSKKSAPLRLTFDFINSDYALEKEGMSKSIAVGAREEVWSELDLQKEADRIIMNRYTPAGVIINDDMEILQFRGQTSPYLEPAPGKASLNLLKMAREGLLLELRTAIHKARKQGVHVRKRGLQVRHNDEFRSVNIEVISINAHASKERYFLVLFEDIKPQATDKSKDIKSGKKPAKVNQRVEARHLLQLKQELSETKQYLRSIIEEQEATNEELKSANEEILSSNEELQITNEELETAKEELQSTNEELTTVNEELQNRNFELSQFNNDINNLLSSVNIPIVMVENDLRIRRFTPMAEKTLNLIPTDIEGSISNIKLNINVPNLEQLILDVIETATVNEQEVQDHNGNWYSMRIHPYRTMENKIDGAVIVLVDIDVSKRSMERIKEAGDYAEAVIETVRESLVVLDSNLRVKTANRAFYNTFQTSREETQSSFIYELGRGQWNIPKLRTLLEDVLSKMAQFESFEVSHDFPHIGRKTMLLNARRIYSKENTQMILLAIEDITDRKRAEETKRKEILLKEIHHRVKNNLQVISSLLSLQAGHLKDAAVIEMFKETQSRIRSIALIHEQLYKNMELATIDFSNYIQNLIPYLFHAYGAGDKISLKMDDNNILLNIDTVVPCGLIVNELVSNSLKHAFPEDKKGEIYVGISSDGNDNYMLTVGDNGVGFPEDLDFRDTQSLGLQLLLMLVEQIEGRIELNRSNGTEFKIMFRELGKKTEL